jgi:hypothetical protein
MLDHMAVLFLAFLFGNKLQGFILKHGGPCLCPPTPKVLNFYDSETLHVRFLKQFKLQIPVFFP